MMKQVSKKALSWLLSLAMLLGMVPGFTLTAKADVEPAPKLAYVTLTGDGAGFDEHQDSGSILATDTTSKAALVFFSDISNESAIANALTYTGTVESVTVQAVAPSENPAVISSTAKLHGKMYYDYVTVSGGTDYENAGNGAVDNKLAGVTGELAKVSRTGNAYTPTPSQLGSRIGWVNCVGEGVSQDGYALMSDGTNFTEEVAGGLLDGYYVQYDFTDTFKETTAHTFYPLTGTEAGVAGIPTCKYVLYSKLDNGAYSGAIALDDHAYKAWVKQGTTVYVVPSTVAYAVGSVACDPDSTTASRVNESAAFSFTMPANALAIEPTMWDLQDVTVQTGTWDNGVWTEDDGDYVEKEYGVNDTVASTDLIVQPIYSANAITTNPETGAITTPSQNYFTTTLPSSEDYTISKQKTGGQGVETTWGDVIGSATVTPANQGSFKLSYGGQDWEFSVPFNSYGFTVEETGGSGTVVFKVGDDVVTNIPSGVVVTMTVTPPTGASIAASDGVTATYRDVEESNQPVTLTGPTGESAAKTYTFTMPASDVTVNVTYSEATYGITKADNQNLDGFTVKKSGGSDAITAAAEGDIIDVSATAKSGFMITGITVVEDIEEEPRSVNTSGMSFVMPAYAVKVSVTTESLDEAKVKAMHDLAEKNGNAYVYTNGATLTTGRYYLSADRSGANKFNGSSTGNGLRIANGATVYIYLNGHTLEAVGKNASGMNGGYAGIYVPSSAKLYFVGDGKVIAKGGDAENGSAGDDGDNGDASAHAGGGGLGVGGSASASATGGAGGAGGNGGGGAGAGIGTNGGSGARASSTTQRNNNVGTGAAAGTIVFLGNVDTTDVNGGAKGTNGSNGDHGAPDQAQDTAKKLMKNLKCSASAQGGGYGSGGQGGFGGTAIGAGGRGGSGGGHGTKGSSASSNSSHNKYTTYFNSYNASGVSESTTPAEANDNAAAYTTANTFTLIGINADLTKTTVGETTITDDRADNTYDVGTTLGTVKNDLTVKAYYSTKSTAQMSEYTGCANGTADAGSNKWAVIDVPQDKINTVTLSNTTSTTNDGVLVKGGNNLQVSYDPGSTSDPVTAKLNVVGKNDFHKYDSVDARSGYRAKAEEETEEEYLAALKVELANNQAAKYDQVNAAKVISYDYTDHNLAELFEEAEGAANGFGDGWNATYAVLYTPYNKFTDNAVTGKVGGNATFELTNPETNADNWLLGGSTTQDAEVKDYFPTTGNKYFDGDSYEATTVTYNDYTGNYADFAKVKVKNAGLYTIYERVLNWEYKTDGTYTKTYTYNTYYVLIEQANLGIDQATDTVYESTKVGDHRITRFVEGKNSEQVFGTFQFDAGYGELWGNDENLVVNQNAPIQSNLQWEFNVFGNKTDNAKDQYTDFDGTTTAYGTKNMNNYLCQNDGQSALDQVATPDSDVQNTYYKGSNGVLSYSGSSTQAAGVNVIPAAMTITVKYVGGQNTATADNAKKDTFTTKDFSSEAVALATYPNPNYAAKSSENKLTSIYAEDLNISGKLTTSGIGWRVVVNDKISGGTSYGTKVTAAPNPAYTADLINDDAYKGDLYVITVKAGEETVLTQKYTDTTATNTVANVISTLTEQVYDELPACEYYGVTEYEVTVDYYGLYYTTEASSTARQPAWSGQEEFQWVVSGVRFYLDVEQREVTLKNTADFHKTYDGTTKLVSQTVSAETATLGDVTAAAPYVVNIDADNNGTQFKHKPAQSLYNYLDPAGTPTNKMDLEIAGDYANKDKGASKSITVAAARFLMTKAEYDLLSNDVKTERADSRVPVTGDKVAALNYKIVDGNSDTAGIATLTGDVDVAQLHFTHGSYGTLTVYDMTPMHEVFDIHVQAYLLTATADTAGFYSALSMAKTELIEKDDEKGSMTFTTNLTAYDYAIDYAINTTVKYDQYMTDKTLVIDGATGKVTHVAERSIGSTNPAAFPAMDVTIGSFPNFKLVSADTTDALLNVCTMQTSIQAEANTKDTSNETWKHEMRFKVKGNGNNYDLLLPVNQLNARAVVDPASGYTPSTFVNRSGGAVQDATAAETYKYVNVYPNGDSVQFDFTIPQDSYLEDVKIVAVKVGDDDYKTFNNATTPVPTFEMLLADETNVIGTFNTQARVGVEDNPETTDVDETIAAGMNNIANPLTLTLKKVNGVAVDDTLAFETAAYFGGSVATGEGYDDKKLATPNEQIGGSTYQFELATGAMSLGENYAIAIVPVIEKYGDLLADKATGADKYATNVTYEKTITSSSDSTPKDGTDKNVYVNYKTLWDTSSYDTDAGYVELSYKAPDNSDVTRSWKLLANTKDAYNSLAIDTTSTNDTNAVGEGSNATFFNYTKLLPGTKVTAKIYAWRNGTVGTVDTTGNDADAVVPGGNPGSSSDTITWTVTREQYESMFGSGLATFKSGTTVLGYAAPGTLNFGAIATFYTNHPTSVGSAAANWSSEPSFNLLTKYGSNWYTNSDLADANKVANTASVSAAAGSTYYLKTSYAPSVSPASSAPATPAAITVPVSGSENTVPVSASVSGATATMAAPSEEKLNEVIAGTDEVTIDMSGLGKDITTAAIPTSTVKAVEAAANSADVGAEELTIKVSDGSVTFDAAALTAIVKQAGGEQIELNLDNINQNSLKTAQRNAIKELNVAAVYDVYLTSNGKRISDFEGGSSTVTVNYKLKDGQVGRGIVVWYVADDGSMTEIPCAYSSTEVTFTVPHFSNYVITYDETRAAVCPQDDTCPISDFVDTDPTAWYHDGVHWALENGVMSGMGDGTFAPNGTTTRAMVAQILWNLEGKPAYVGMSEYADVDNEDWFGPAVRWASAEGIVTGYANPGDSGMIFDPNGAVTREQLATMLYRYAQYKGIDVSVGEDTNILSYEDAMGVSTWAMAAMQWACGAGVVNGVAANGTMYLQPQNTAVRCVVATMFMRFAAQAAK